ncbi:hypothetical protein FRC17_008397 [Serendipita sp. 399]|nr:hypothetical protein FRC17_008397 [Serendipita sp. 399]
MSFATVDGGKVKKQSSSCAECKRYILSSTEELHTKIDQLLERVRDLEVALDASYSLHSTGTHGLLKKDLLVEGSRLALERDHDEEAEVPVAAFGTLKISEKTGGAEWIGSTASSYFFEDARSGISSSMEAVSEADYILQEMTASLPSKEEAWSLLESYHENFTWNYNPVPRTLLIKEFLAPTYDPNQGPLSALHLSVLFSMLSIGSQMDLSRAPNPKEAKLYRDIAKMPLDIESLSKDTSIVTIEALMMYAQAIQWSDDPNGPALTWTYLTLSVTLGESVSSSFSPTSITIDTMIHRLGSTAILSQPGVWTTRLHYGEEGYFEETAETMGADPTFHLWRYRWTKELGWPTADQLLSPAYPPTHALVMKIDRKIREFGFPWDVNAKPDPNSDEQDVLLDLENMMMNGILELTSLHVHRGFFAHALFQSPSDPLQTKFSPSVYAAFGAACRIIQRARDYYSRRPLIMKRSSIMYSHTFSAAVVAGAIATQAPQCSLASAAMHELDVACAIFKSGQENIRVQKFSYVVTRLQAKARDVFQSRNAMLRNPETTVDLPGIISTPTVVKSSSQSPEGSLTHGRSPPAESPPTYDSYPRTSPQREEMQKQINNPEPFFKENVRPYEVTVAQVGDGTMMHNGAAPPLEEYLYPVSQQDLTFGYPYDWASGQYYVPQAPPEVYMQSSRVAATQPQDIYGWQQQQQHHQQQQRQQQHHQQQQQQHQREQQPRRSSVIGPNMIPQYQNPPQPPQPVPVLQHEAYRQLQSFPVPHTQYIASTPGQGRPYPPVAQETVAPDQSWAHFLGRMGVQ